jgi:hypothetical protein
MAVAEDEALAVARGYHRAWTGKQFEKAGRYLSESLRTDIPASSYETKAQFLAALTRFGQLTTDVELLAEFSNGREAMLLYDMEIEPVGTLRMAEQLVVSGGQITFIRHVNDTAPLRAAGFAPAPPERS